MSFLSTRRTRPSEAGRTRRAAHLETLEDRSCPAAPVLSLNATSASFDEDSPPVLLAPSATVSDADGLVLTDAILRFKLVPPPPGIFPTDSLGLRDQGPGPGSLNVDGYNLYYSDAYIGTITETTTTSGTAEHPTLSFAVWFESGASQAAVEAVLRNLTFVNPLDDPGDFDRTVTCKFIDGNAEESQLRSLSVHVNPSDDPPQLIPFPTDPIQYVGGTSAVRVLKVNPRDPDTDGFENGTITVQTLSADAGDRLGLEAYAGSTLEISGTTISLSGTVIGTFSGGAGSTPLVVSFNEAATFFSQDAGVVLAAVSFRTLNQVDPAQSRSFSAVLTNDQNVSSNVYTTTITILPVNVAPVLDTSRTYTLNSIAEDQVDSNGTLVKDLIDGAITDGNVDPKFGIAVVAASRANGIWQYSLNGGAFWRSSGLPEFASQGQGLVLPADSLTRIRFVPNLNYFGSQKLYFRAWDQTKFVTGQQIAIFSNRTGGSYSISSEYAFATLNVTPRNDPPVLTPAHPSLGSIDEDTTNPAGKLVSAVLGNSVTDPDPDAVEGIAVLGASSAHGVWQYSLNGGTNWNSMGIVSQSAARLLRASDLVRFLPNANFNGAVKLYYRAWDQTQGTPGATINTKNRGATSPTSTEYDDATLTVAVNDVPVLTQNDTATVNYALNSTPGVRFMVGATSDAPTTLSDVDSPNFSGGVLLVHTSAGGHVGDRISLSGNYSLLGTDVRYRNPATGTLFSIGTLTSNGVDGSDFSITFKATATQVRVQGLINALRLRTTNGVAGTRSMQVNVSDGDGGTSNVLTRNVSVS